MGEAPGEPRDQPRALTLVRNWGEVPCRQSLHFPLSFGSRRAFYSKNDVLVTASLASLARGRRGTTLPRRPCFVSLTRTLANDGPGQGGISGSSCMWAGLPCFSPRTPFASAVGSRRVLTGRARGQRFSSGSWSAAFQGRGGGQASPRRRCPRGSSPPRALALLPGRPDLPGACAPALHCRGRRPVRGGHRGSERDGRPAEVAGARLSPRRSKRRLAGWRPRRRRPAPRR